MDENFNNNQNTNADNERPVTPPVTPPNGNYRYGYNPGNSYTNQGNQYMPYGSYYNQPSTPEKKSKGKKKGAVIAAVIVGIVFLIALLVIGLSFFGGNDSGNEAAAGKDDTQMNLVEEPEKDNSSSVTKGTLSAKEIYQNVHESSVGVLVYTNTMQSVASEGTGIVMGTNSDKTATYIITCAHVLDVKNPQIIIQTADGTQYDGVIVGSDEKTDIGLVRVATTDLKPAEFADSQKVEVGETVYAIGNPGGTQFFGSFTNGMVSAIGRPVDSPVGYEVACIQHTAAINPGNSGGALVNEFGQVIGINSSKIASTEYEGMGFAVPSSTVKEIVDELIKNGYVSNRPVLGINFMVASKSQIHSVIIKANNLPAGSIIIDSIMTGSDLLNTEVKEGDMITAVNGKELDSYETLLEVIENGKVGDTITLEICRIDANYNISSFETDVKLVEDSSTSSPETDNSNGGFYFPFGN